MYKNDHRVMGPSEHVNKGVSQMGHQEGWCHSRPVNDAIDIPIYIYTMGWVAL